VSSADFIKIFHFTTGESKGLRDGAGLVFPTHQATLKPVSLVASCRGGKPTMSAFTALTRAGCVKLMEHFAQQVPATHCASTGVYVPDVERLVLEQWFPAAFSLAAWTWKHWQDTGKHLSPPDTHALNNRIEELDFRPAPLDDCTQSQDERQGRQVFGEEDDEVSAAGKHAMDLHERKRRQTARKRALVLAERGTGESMRSRESGRYGHDGGSSREWDEPGVAPAGASVVPESLEDVGSGDGGSHFGAHMTTVSACLCRAIRRWRQKKDHRRLKLAASLSSFSTLSVLYDFEQRNDDLTSRPVAFIGMLPEFMYAESDVLQ
jgi:hypothetical protein